MRCPVCHAPLSDDAAFCPWCASPTGRPEHNDYRYEAFISYRHIPRDRALARRIQRRVEGFRVPRELRERAGRARLGKCFRDEDELPTSDSLPHLIETALRESRFLIVVCSPEMRESLWVAREIELFASYHGRSNILLALSSGEPDEAFPALLRGLAEKNDEGEVITREVEPIAADMRTSSRKRFSDEVLRILAPIVGCGYDDLRQRMRARLMQRSAVVAAGVAATSLAFGAFALFQQSQIQANYEAALKNQSEYLAEEAMSLYEQGDRLQAIQVALFALGADGTERPYTPSARLALERACQVYPGTYWQPVYSNAEPTGVNDELLEVSADGSFYVASTREGTASTYDTLTGRRLATIDLTAERSKSDRVSEADSVALCGNTIVYLADNNLLFAYDALTGERLWRREIDLFATDLCASDDGDLLAAIDYESNHLANDDEIVLIDAQTGRTVLPETMLPHSGETESLSLINDSPSCFSADSALFAHAAGGTVHIFDTHSSTWRSSTVSMGNITALALDGNTLYSTAILELPDEVLYQVAAHDLTSLRRLWVFEDNATLGLGDSSVYEPEILDVSQANGATHLLCNNGKDVLLCSADDGSVRRFTSDAQAHAASLLVESDSRAYVTSYCDGELLLSDNPFEGGDETSSLDSYPAGYSSSLTVPCPDAERAIFFTDSNGTSSCLMSDATETFLYRFVPYEELPSVRVTGTMSDDYERRETSASGVYQAVMPNDFTIEIYDALTFDLMHTIDLTPYLDPDEEDPFCPLTFNPCREEMLYVSVEDGMSEGRACELLCAIDASSGMVTGVLENHDALVYQWLSSDGQTVTLPATDGESTLTDRIVTADARTLEVLSSVPVEMPEESGSVFELGVLGSLAYVMDSDHSLYTFDLQSGDLVETGISGLHVFSLSETDSHVAVNASRTRAAVYGTDGVLRLFDEKGNALWESTLNMTSASNFYSGQNFVTILPDSNLLVQDGSYQCLLISGEDGSVLAFSTGDIDSEISGGRVSADGSIFYADTLSSTIAINLNPSSFGVESSLPVSCAIDENGGLVSFWNRETTFTLPLYTTDELIDYAQQLIEGHELTEAQRRQYHLE